ncbi:MAG: nitrate/nitrite transporter, NarK, partial [Anaerocolumna sp.]|nr:nitrate/nitrite transporter, NarK [Anaerocolumna sp.]
INWQHHFLPLFIVLPYSLCANSIGNMSFQTHPSNYTKKRWQILIVSCLINLCIGSLYAWSVFAGPMAQYLSERNSLTLTSASLAIVFTVANSVGSITMISGGWLNERLGTKAVVFLGGILLWHKDV